MIDRLGLNAKIAGGIVMFLGVLVGLYLISNQRQYRVAVGEPEFAHDVPESFAFFDLGANTQLNAGERRKLNRRLGSSAISYRGTVDLNLIYPNFLQDHFPELHELNRRLNPPRERVEHAVTRLMFRHTRGQQIPFSTVDLVFSNYNGRPFFFSMELSPDGLDILEALKERYGNPDQIVWNNGSHQALFWKKEGDVLIFSITPDRLGNPRYGLRIFYTHTISQLLSIEAEKALERAQQRREAGRTAF